ncbi:MAG: TetR-like C-terminal domain-containing protein [Polyangiaceae bacterium]
MSDDGAIDQIYAALVARELTAEDLSARRLAAFLGKTTGAIYHRWGSFDGLLFTVGQRGFVDLQARIEAVWAAKRELGPCAVAFVEFGLDHPEIYPLMFERRFDWAALRAAGYFERATPGSALLACIVGLVRASGAEHPIPETRLLMAGLHGLVSFASSGRMNTGDLSSSDRAVAIASARDLAARVCAAKAAPKARSRRSKPKHPRARP